jgi:hypothetical protein
MRDKLIELQKRIDQYYVDNEEPFRLEYSTRIYFFQSGGHYDVKFFGESYELGFGELLDLLSKPDNAAQIIGLSFDGPDAGANGSTSWDFSRIINDNVTFPNLLAFKVKLTDLGDHNQSIIDGHYLLENGMVAKLLAKMPNLETLVIPSAPDHPFFEIGEHPLREFTLQAGYDHQNFISNLAGSSNFKSLVFLDYTERFDDTGDPDKEQFTSFEAFKKLFISEAFASVRHFRLRGSNLTMEQLYQLQRLNPIQFMYINCQIGNYIGNRMNKI